ncbi:MAG TPA: NADH-dependent flavin oxidoreductase [Methanosphaera sp.]|nr:NADH-dependent flavin oxidoreductase [Methanosphaera sp.]
MKDIFDRCKLGSLELNSRIIRTGIWESQNENNRLTKNIYDRYDNIASSGVGMITSEIISLYPKDKFNNYTHKIYDPNFVHDFRKLTDIVHEYEVPILAQLGFVNFNRGIDLNIDINDLNITDIRKIQMDLISSAKKLSFAGFDGLQLQLGNNFFLSKFINPYFNHRKDEYGNDTFGRMRIVLEAIKVIKDNFDMHINCRVNAYDGRKGGITSQESIEMCKLLEKYGADSLQITKPLSPLYFTREKTNTELLDYCVELIKHVNLPVILGGGLKSKNQINDVLNNKSIEFFSMYRPFIAQPDFLNDWKQNKNIESRCNMCNNCYRQKNSVCHYI